MPKNTRFGTVRGPSSFVWRAKRIGSPVQPQAYAAHSLRYTVRMQPVPVFCHVALPTSPTIP
ncbi:uncharacterized protein LY79DRAFT_541467 [Colletotrichum navitas]|uniref:Uncharacterized protein n=1 Tax=Colletotrichum navitas TaxID=681940 RepID=A0AAD8QA70_9PEZI|nr:uncharacterized protein LY79DRAFT_541467 [Colletotrichum navitas]KAK1597374.1 hypothetical protein LY79DRAFT_541467 [Colletotrichum navitas]